jgi:hypothetical protein
MTGESLRTCEVPSQQAPRHTPKDSAADNNSGYNQGNDRANSSLD